jgi:hypothetical protein
MHDYQKFALMMTPVEEKDLILFDMSPEDKAYAVKQYNRALLNAQRDGTDVSQIILKPMIQKYPAWGDCALVYGLCLAREKEFARAENAMEYAVNNTLSSEQNLAIAQESMKLIREDLKNPEPKPEVPKSGKNWTSLANSGAAARTGMQAPILVKATNRTNDFQLASEKERRDILMRSAAVGDEMASDDIAVEDVRTPADRLRLTVKIVAGFVIIALVFALVFFVVLPTISKIKTSKDTEARLDYLISELDKNKDDPEVAGIIGNYAAEFDEGGAVAATTAATTTTAESTEAVVEETEATTEDMAPVIPEVSEETEGEESLEGEGEETVEDDGETPDEPEE